MKKALNFVLVLLFLISSTFAFDVFDDNDQIRTYFNLANDDLTVKTSQNLSVMTMEYVGVNSTIVSNYSFSSCDNLNCAQISISDFVSNNGLTLLSSKYTLRVGSDSKDIYLDIEDPSFTLSNSIIDSETDELKLYFNYSDNFEVKSVQIYEELGGNLIFLQNTTENTYVRSIDAVGSVDLVFRISDVSGNSKDYSDTFFVEDIFEPQILDTFLTMEDGDVDFYFKASDSDLSRYELVQNSLKLSETMTGSTYETTVAVPFESGSFTLVVYDGEDNSVSKTIDLGSPFSKSYDDKYSNENVFEFRSSADKCVLLSVNSEIYDDVIDKDGNDFEIELDVFVSKEYELRYYCENGDYKIYYERDFYYDINDPTISNITLEALQDGNIEINWEESEDNESNDLEYVLYRNSDKIYSGSKTSYTDKSVTYPNEYEYYLKVSDEAGNKVESSKKKITPMKTEIVLLTNLENSLTVKSNISSIEVTTDVGSTIDLLVKNGNFLVHSQNLKATQTKNSFNIPLIDGTNQVEIKVSDDFGNAAEKVVLLTYDAPPPPPVPVVAEVVNETVAPIEVEEEPLEGTNFWIWLIVWLVIIGFFLWYFVFNENRLREKMVHMVSKDKKKVKKSDGAHDLVHRRNRDKALAKNLVSIQKDREDRHFARERAKKRVETKEKREMSDYDKKKHQDLENRAVKKENLFEKKEHERESSKPKREVKREGFFKSLMSVFGSKKEKEEKKDDPMSNYISRQKRSSSWDNPNLYRQSYHDRRKAQADAKKKEEEDAKVAKQVEEEHAKKAAAREEERKRKKQEEESNRKHGIEKRDKLSLDDYLSKRTRKKRFLFAEREVERDIRNRK